MGRISVGRPLRLGIVGVVALCAPPGVGLADQRTASHAGFSNPVQSAGRDIYTQGAGGSAPACADCHGTDGQGQTEPGGAPAIGGMQPAYLEAQLKAFVSGSRKNQTMDAIARGLNKTQISEVTAYISTLPGITGRDMAQVSDVGGADLVKQGRILFQYGKKISRDEWVPSCNLCHGKQAQGAGSQFPPLAGQHAGYVANQLHAWQKGERANDPNGLMTTIAAKLSDEDIKAVAAYLASMANAEQPIWPYKPTEITK